MFIMKGIRRVSITGNPVEHRKNIRWALLQGWHFVSISQDVDGTLYAYFVEPILVTPEES